MAAAHEPCVVKLVYKSAAGSMFPPIFESRSGIMDLQKSDLTKMPICPYVNRPVFKPKDYLVLRLKPDGADTIVLTSSTVYIPVTFRDVRTGAVYERYLTGTDFSENDGGTDGIAYAAAQEMDFAYYQVPDGVEMKLGHRIAQNSRICIAMYDDTA